MLECYSDPYKKEFDAVVSSVKSSGNALLVKLSPNFFFASSGGQACDQGELSWLSGSAKVVEVLKEGGEAVLRVEASAKASEQLKIGAGVKCKIDWTRRHQLMKAHSGEHMLFQSLERQYPGIYPQKVTLEPGAFSLFVKIPSLDWPKVCEAEKLVNSEIRKNTPIKTTIYKKSEVPEAARIKLDRIEEDDVRIVEAVGFDLVACSGLHVHSAGELGFLCVSRINKEPAGVWKLEFLVGDEAVSFALANKNYCLSASSALKATPANLEKTVSNMLAEAVANNAELKELGNLSFCSLNGFDSGEYKVFYASFSSVSQKRLSEWLAKITKEDSRVVVFSSAGLPGAKSTLLLGKSKNVKLDLAALGKEAFALFNGKGGGNEFYQIGSGDSAKLSASLAFLSEKLSFPLNLIISQ